MVDPRADELQARGSDLEKAYINEYLLSLGYRPEQLKTLPATQRHNLLCAASLYASTRLAEVESKSHLIEELHGGERPV